MKENKKLLDKNYKLTKQNQILNKNQKELNQQFIKTQNKQASLKSDLDILKYRLEEIQKEKSKEPTFITT